MKKFLNNIKIKNNALYIKRKNNMYFQQQGCPRQNGEIFCGEWCPLFLFEISSQKTEPSILFLCEKTYYVINYKLED